MNARTPGPSDWRAGVSDRFVAAVGRAIEQYRADIDYEANSPTVSDTRKQLLQAGQLATELRKVIRALSPVAKAALWDVASRTRSGRQCDRQRFGRDLISLARDAGVAASKLVDRHSDALVTGRGAGSRAAKDSELRAIKWNPDHQAADDIRNPKDKFGASVIMAYLLDDPSFDCFSRGASKKLEQLLIMIWRDVSDQPVSWVRLLKGRKAIVERVNRTRRAREIRQRSARKRNASGRKQGTTVPK